MTKRIPTLLALLLLTGGVGLTVVATQSVRTLFTQAQTTTAPKNIRVTNISDTSFTVTYVTDVAAKGSAGLVGQTFFPDDRDQSLSSSDSYYTHYVTVKNLSPSTEYQYQVEGGTATYKITTAPTVTQTASLAEPVYGKVVKKDGTPAAGAIVYFPPLEVHLFPLMSNRTVIFYCQLIALEHPT